LTAPGRSAVFTLGVTFALLEDSSEAGLAKPVSGVVLVAANKESPCR
jgi:hypothetical protein